MLCDDPQRRTQHPAGSKYQPLGRFCGNATLCTSCHPRDCRSDCCNDFTDLDVAEGHVGRSCERCGNFLPGSERRAL